MHVVAATGYDRSAHYPPWHWAREVSGDVLLDILLTDLTTGIDDRDRAGLRPVPTQVKAGIVKLGASYRRITTDEDRWLRAGVEAALRAGVQVAVVGRAFLSRLEQRLGARPRRSDHGDRPRGPALGSAS
ncbi:hypothetical protein ACQEVF_38240 [Nonomuraea polychroma]|uniref:phosphotriesterase family protein n=1 Tax=Nonomuraea polychroma TaxID=46176 RepID=UPI003D9263EF